MSVNTEYDVPAAVPPKDVVSTIEVAVHAGGTVVDVVDVVVLGVEVVVVVVEWLWC